MSIREESFSLFPKRKIMNTLSSRIFMHYKVMHGPTIREIFQIELPVHFERWHDFLTDRVLFKTSHRILLNI